MEVNEYIYELLFQYDCVILPDFGGFIANYRSAEIIPEFNSFNPPGKTILFNRNLVHNDGLLISYISQTEGIEYVKSRNIVVGFVNHTLRKFENGARITFDGIGLFYFDKENNLQFEPANTTNFLLESYGLPSFRFNTIRDVNIEKVVRRRFAESKQAISANRKTAVRKVIIAAPLLLALLFVPVRSHIFRNGSFTSMVPGNIPASVRKLASGLQVGQTVISTKDSTVNQAINTPASPELTVTAVPAEPVKETSQPAVTDQPSVEGHYFIIAGSFRTQKVASQFVQEINDDKYDIRILEPDNGRIRVSVFSSPGRAEAIERLNVLKAKHPDYWLLSK